VPTRTKISELCDGCRGQAPTKLELKWHPYHKRVLLCPLCEAKLITFLVNSYVARRKLYFSKPENQAEIRTEGPCGPIVKTKQLLFLENRLAAKAEERKTSNA
jgi:hypothetical protein